MHCSSYAALQNDALCSESSKRQQKITLIIGQGHGCTSSPAKAQQGLVSIFFYQISVKHTAEQSLFPLLLLKSDATCCSLVTQTSGLCLQSICPRTGWFTALGRLPWCTKLGRDHPKRVFVVQVPHPGLFGPTLWWGRNIPDSGTHLSLRDSPVVRTLAALLTAPAAQAKLLQTGDEKRGEDRRGFFLLRVFFCLCTAGKFSLGNSRAALQLL